VNNGIGAPTDHPPRPSLPLDPSPGNDMHGRSGFYIHGDNNRGDNSASTGCIILGKAIRKRIGNSGDNTLHVIP
jgi:hypothetical protein